MDSAGGPPEDHDSPPVDGGLIPGGDGPAYRLYRGADAVLPVLIAAPHGGRSYPPSILAGMRDAERATLRLEDRHVDTLARAVARQTGAALLVAEAPRAVIDLNRAPDDIDWSMVAGGRPAGARHSLANRRARSGLGLVPRRLPGTGEIWRAPLEKRELEERIDLIHRPYHRAVGETLDRMGDRWGAALLLDLHSMPPLRPRNPEEPPAEFVVGDRFGVSCDARLTAISLRHFGEAGRAVNHNRPYSGGYVLDRHGAPTRGVHALQLEICRSTYLDARLETPSIRLPAVARMLAGLIRALASEVAALGRDSQIAQAAE